MITVIGEALIDLVKSPGEPPKAHVGGSPLNVAVGLARLGIEVSFGATVGSDEYGRQIRDYLASHGAPLVEMAPTSAVSNVAIAKLDSKGEAEYSFHLTWEPDFMPAIDERVVALYTGSLATAIEPGATFMLEVLRREHDRKTATLAYDPNIRPSLAGDRSQACERVESIVDVVDVVKASEQDVEWLYPNQPYEKVAQAWLDRGPAIVVITRGEDGAYAISSAGEVEHSAQNVEVADTIGAGDAFMAGLLAGLDRQNLLGGGNLAELSKISTEALTAVLTLATDQAAAAVQRVGA